RRCAVLVPPRLHLCDLSAAGATGRPQGGSCCPRSAPAHCLATPASSTRQEAGRCRPPSSALPQGLTSQTALECCPAGCKADPTSVPTRAACESLLRCGSRELPVAASR